MIPFIFLGLCCQKMFMMNSFLMAKIGETERNKIKDSYFQRMAYLTTFISILMEYFDLLSVTLPVCMAIEAYL